MRELKSLFENNQAWATRIEREDPGFFARLSEQQTPQILWIGCSDSRVPANQIVDLPPGEIFVHRNIANQVFTDDLNLLCVLQYAVDVLKVRHVIVCGHYGCGGVQAAMGEALNNRLDNWLAHIRLVYQQYKDRLAQLGSPEWQQRTLCELNVVEQARNLCRTDVIEKAWARGQAVTIHGWIYDIHDGLLRDLDACISAPEQLEILDLAVQRRLNGRIDERSQ